MDHSDSCPFCLGDTPLAITELSEHQVSALSDMVSTEGWRIYLDVIRRKAKNAIEDLLNYGDEKGNRYRAVALKENLKFHEYVGEILSKPIEDEGVSLRQMVEGNNDR